MQKLAWYLQLLLKLIQHFKFPLKISRQGVNHDHKHFVFLCVFCFIFLFLGEINLDSANFMI